MRTSPTGTPQSMRLSAFPHRMYTHILARGQNNSAQFQRIDCAAWVRWVALDSARLFYLSTAFPVSSVSAPKLLCTVDLNLAVSSLGPPLISTRFDFADLSSLIYDPFLDCHQLSNGCQRKPHEGLHWQRAETTLCRRNHRTFAGQLVSTDISNL